MNLPDAIPKVLTGKIVRGPISARMSIDGRSYLNFFGSGYLALAGVQEIREAVRRVLDEGAPFAQQLSAAHGAIDPIFDEIEHAAAAASGREAALYFASGYMIGTVGLATLNESFDLIAIDEAAHYSLKDAAKLSGKGSFAFAHCDAQSLADTLERYVKRNERPLVMTDGAFATTGRIPPLAEYVQVLSRYEGRLFIDESHAFGVVGENGRGAAEYCGVESLVRIGGTFSKAYCAQGAFVDCSAAHALRMRTVPPLSAACAGSPLTAAAAIASLKYVAAHPEARHKLRDLTHYLRTRLRAIGIDVIASPAPIVAFRIGNRAEMQATQQRAFERGIYLHHSNYIGAGAEGVIRCAVFRDHSKADIDRLIAALSE